MVAVYFKTTITVFPALVFKQFPDVNAFWHAKFKFCIDKKERQKLVQWYQVPFLEKMDSVKVAKTPVTLCRVCVQVTADL